MELRERVKIARLIAGYSTIQLATTMGIARTNIVRWEAGIQDLPRGQAAKLAITTGVPEQWLRGGELEGLLIARPGRFIPPKTQPLAYAYLTSKLPELTKDARCICAMEHGDRTWIFVTEKYCLCIVCLDKLQLRPDSECESFKIDGLQYGLGDNRGVEELLKKVGLHQWSSMVPVAEETKTVHIEMDISINGPTDEMTAINIAKAAAEKIRTKGFTVKFKYSSVG